MQETWEGVVEKKGRAAFDGANLYRRVVVRLDDGTTAKVRVSRALWDELGVGDRLVKEAGTDPRRA